MLQNFGTPITDDTKDAREALRLALGLDESVPFADYINYINTSTDGYDPAELFSAGQNGFFYELYDIGTLFQDSSGVKPVKSHNDPIGKVLDKSGNGNHASQAVSSKRVTYKESPARFVLDKVDDVLIVNIPTGGWVGTMVIATTDGTASYEVDIPAGNYLLGGRYFLNSSIVGVLFREGALTDSESIAVQSYFISRGAVDSYINVSDFRYFWRYFDALTRFPLINTLSAVNFSFAWDGCVSLTDFPLLDTSNTNTLYFAWSDCRKLTKFPLINTSKVRDFAFAWKGCVSLTDFPLLDTSNATRFISTWSTCSLLTNFPPNAFDNIKGGDFSGAFANTNLNQKSIDGILTSLVTSGVATGTRIFYQSGGSAPSAIGEAAIDTLRERGWTVTVNGGY